MEATIIGVLGAGLLGLLGIFLQAIRADLRRLSDRIDEQARVTQEGFASIRSEFHEKLSAESQSIRSEFHEKLSAESESIRSEFHEKLAAESESIRSEFRERLAAELGSIRSDFHERLTAESQSIRSEFHERLAAESASIRSELDGIRVLLAKIEATQAAHHGRLLASAADHGERIAALEAAARG